MEEKRNGRKKVGAIIAIAAGLALLAGGGTFALWSAYDSVNGGTITAGDLNIVAKDAKFWDVTTLRADETDSVVAVEEGEALTFDTVPPGVNATSKVMKGHEITSIADWRMVPEDTVALVMPFEVTLEGDNLVAKMVLDASDLFGQQDIDDAMEYTFALFDATGTQIGTTRAISADDDEVILGYIQANDSGQADGVNDVYQGTSTEIPMVDVNKTAIITVVVFAHFDAEDRDHVGDADVLNSLTVTLTQVRGPVTQ